MILKKYKNQILKTIQESGIDEGLFIAKNEAIKGVDNFVIILLDSPIRFLIKPWLNSLTQFMYNYSQFVDGFSLSSEYSYTDDINLSNKIKDWLDTVVRPYLDELNTPDLWERFLDDYADAKNQLGTPDDFQPFSDEEKIPIRLSINELSLSIKNNFNPNRDQLKIINDRLKYLSDALDKHNKFDWRGIAISSAISIMIALSLSSKQGHQLFQLFQKIFPTVLHLLP